MRITKENLRLEIMVGTSCQSTFLRASQRKKILATKPQNFLDFSIENMVPSEDKIVQDFYLIN